MLRALNNSAAGIDAQAKKVDVIANNIANVNTAGYKKQTVSFADLFYRQIAKPGLPVNGQPANRRPIAEGSGVRVAATDRDWQQGAILETGRELDFAIQGKGFFEVQLPDGSYAYTRSGVFTRDDNGWLVTPQGYPLTVPFELDPELEGIVVSPDGRVTAKNRDGESEELGYWPLYYFTNPAGLAAVGDNLFVATEASGELWEALPGEDGLGTIRQGALEGANVSLAEEMTALIEAQRAYQINSRALQTADEMWSMANNLRR